MNGIVRTSKLIDKNGINSVVLSNSNMILFVTGSNGTIYSVKIPLKEQSGYLDIIMHSAGVNQVIGAFHKVLELYSLTSFPDVDFF